MFGTVYSGQPLLKDTLSRDLLSLRKYLATFQSQAQFTNHQATIKIKIEYNILNFRKLKQTEVTMYVLTGGKFYSSLHGSNTKLILEELLLKRKRIGFPLGMGNRRARPPAAEMSVSLPKAQRFWQQLCLRIKRRSAGPADGPSRWEGGHLHAGGSTASDSTHMNKGAHLIPLVILVSYRRRRRNILYSQ